MRIFKPKKPPLRSVLFVCTANITRSPAAEYMFRSLAERSGEDWTVASAGMQAIRNGPAHEVVKFVLARRGLPIGSHRSQPVSEKLLSRFHWIIVMERAHCDELLQRDPSLAGRVQVLRELGVDVGPENPDMPDPTGRTVEDYAGLFEILDAEIPRVFAALRNRVSDLSWEEE